MLAKAADALETQTSEERLVGSETLSFHPQDLPAVSAIIEDAMIKIIAKANARSRPTDVYHLGFQFFRLTNTKRKK